MNHHYESLQFEFVESLLLSTMVDDCLLIVDDELFDDWGVVVVNVDFGTGCRLRCDDDELWQLVVDDFLFQSRLFKISISLSSICS